MYCHKFASLSTYQNIIQKEISNVTNYAWLKNKEQAQNNFWFNIILKVISSSYSLAMPKCKLIALSLSCSTQQNCYIFALVQLNKHLWENSLHFLQFVAVYIQFYFDSIFKIEYNHSLYYGFYNSVFGNLIWEFTFDWKNKSHWIHQN